MAEVSGGIWDRMARWLKACWLGYSVEEMLCGRDTSRMLRPDRRGALDAFCGT
ncbi:hypothetical protein [Infirmifilum sp. NZ]|uniref:hypothetical protein n=1 Tax=Infirmifilum sp. NZ TaxID=2926850 RepID=UPI0027AB786F|nr:hypothetical protein [Infirmifilum sp. NZ]UNQ74337.1 hypothetical protein MOV14_04850 [Infirmifilum sp. NZ]